MYKPFFFGGFVNLLLFMKLKTVAYFELSQIVMLFAIAGDAIFPGDASVGQVSTFEHTSCRKVGF